MSSNKYSDIVKLLVDYWQEADALDWTTQDTCRQLVDRLLEYWPDELFKAIRNNPQAYTSEIHSAVVQAAEADLIVSQLLRHLSKGKQPPSQQIIVTTGNDSPVNVAGRDMKIFGLPPQPSARLPHDTDDRGFWLDQLESHRRNLRLLEKQRTTYAVGEEPLHLLNKIEAEKREIASLKEKLGLSPASPSDVEQEEKPGS